jgi:REP element-mobilizing transposase RayT
MARGNRHSLAGYVWHITERCHRKQFLLKFARDHRAWVRWLFEARKRFELCVLNYQVTCNHVHLLVQDRDRGEVARSMQLIAGCVGRASAGYHEIQHGAPRYRIVDRVALCELLGIAEQGLAKLQNEWIESRLTRGNLERKAEAQAEAQAQGAASPPVRAGRLGARRLPGADGYVCFSSNSAQRA